MRNPADNSIEAILFDAVGTLFSPRGSIGDIYRSIALEFGVDIGSAALEAGFVRETAGRPTPVTKDEWKGLVRRVLLDLGPFPEFDEFFEEVFAVFESGQSWICYPETRRVLRRLDQRGLKMAVVSNFDRRLLRVLGDLEIDRYFDAVVTPDSAGQAKPDPRIFIDAIAQLGVDADRTLVVGDDPTMDVAAARAAGLRAVLVDRTGRTSGAIANLGGLDTLIGIG
jgi:putative hydrolase of the HAD superfamily